MELLLKKLSDSNLTIGSIESMTAGLFASTIAGVPGASKVFKGSVVTYATEIKTSVVGVDDKVINEHGVVSSEVAYQMAEKGKKLLNVDICVSVTGNAGPTCEPGGKDVGVFYIGVATKNGVITKEYKINGNRNDIRNSAVLAMRDLVYSLDIR